MKKTYHCNVAELGENSSQGLNFRSITPRSKVLDVGCAVGDMGLALVQHKQCSVWGIEYDAERAQAARETNAYRQVWQLDLDTLTDAGLPGMPEDFDFIVLGDVLEHLQDPLSTLIRLKRLLGKEGKLLLSLPNIAHCSIKCGLLLNEFKYMPEGLLDESHLRFFTWQSIAQFCAASGVQILESRRTYLGIEGFGSPTDYRRLPAPILQFVFADPHSLVCQYVLTLQPSGRSEAELAAGNRERLACRWEDCPESIRNYAASLLQQVGAPPVPPPPVPQTGICISVCDQRLN